jgi:hypothetical protein
MVSEGVLGIPGRRHAGSMEVGYGRWDWTHRPSLGTLVCQVGIGGASSALTLSRVRKQMFLFQPLQIDVMATVEYSLGAGWESERAMPPEKLKCELGMQLANQVPLC